MVEVRYRRCDGCTEPIELTERHWQVSLQDTTAMNVERRVRHYCTDCLNCLNVSPED